MKVGDRVKKSPMWKHAEAYGRVVKVTKDGYTIVKWDNILGEWYYTKEQSKKIEIVEEADWKV